MGFGRSALGQHQTAGPALDAGASIHQLARQLVNDTRDALPVAKDGQIIGLLNRQEALGVLLGDE